MALQRPMAGVTRWWGENAQKRETLEAQKQAQKTRRVPAVHCTHCWAVFIIIADSFGSRFGFVHGIDVAIKGVIVTSGVGVETRGSYELLN